MRPGSHARTDHSGRHVDIGDSRIGQRRIRNLSPKQEKLLAPRIDRGRGSHLRTIILDRNNGTRGPPVHAGGLKISSFGGLSSTGVWQRSFVREHVAQIA